MRRLKSAPRHAIYLVVVVVVVVVARLGVVGNTSVAGFLHFQCSPRKQRHHPVSSTSSGGGLGWSRMAWGRCGVVLIVLV